MTLDELKTGQAGTITRIEGEGPMVQRLMALGLLAGFAAFLASGLMAAAYFMVHAPQGFWPIINKGELAVVYCFLFLYIAARGSGPYSVDAAMRKR